MLPGPDRPEIRVLVRAVKGGDGGLTHLPPLVLNDAELATAGVSADMVRLSVGIEHIDDILADISQALEQA